MPLHLLRQIASNQKITFFTMKVQPVMHTSLVNKTFSELKLIEEKLQSQWNQYEFWYLIPEARISTMNLAQNNCQRPSKAIYGIWVIKEILICVKKIFHDSWIINIPYAYFQIIIIHPLIKTDKITVFYSTLSCKDSSRFFLKLSDSWIKTF